MVLSVFLQIANSRGEVNPNENYCLFLLVFCNIDGQRGINSFYYREESTCYCLSFLLDFDFSLDAGKSRVWGGGNGSGRVGFVFHLTNFYPTRFYPFTI